MGLNQSRFLIGMTGRITNENLGIIINSFCLQLCNSAKRGQG